MSLPENMVLNNPVSTVPFQVAVANDVWEREAIYKLRYNVYVREMSKPIAKSKKHILSDPLDMQSLLLYVSTNHEIIATVRITIGNAQIYGPELAKVFALDKCAALVDEGTNQEFALTTKLAVKMEYRNSSACYLLLAETYRILTERGINFWFGGCNPYLIPLYERMGFRQFTKNFTDPGYGLLVPIIILVEDTDHFRAVRSPLYRQAKKKLANQSIAQRFQKAFPFSACCPNSRLMTPQNLRLYLNNKLNDAKPPNAQLSLFKSLEEPQILEILSCGSIFACWPGDYLITQGSRCNDLYLLLSGTMRAESAGTPARFLLPGAAFGGLELPEQAPQPETVMAASDCELLVIPRQAFERYRHTHPAAAAALLQNLNNNQPGGN